MRKNSISLRLPHWKGVLPLHNLSKGVFLLIFLTCSLITLAQKEGKLEVTNGILVKSIANLKTMRPDPNFKPRVTRDETGLLANKKVNRVRTEYTSVAQADPVVQREAATSVSAPTVIGQNYDGMGFTNVSPADPTLTTGNNHVIQMINGGNGSYIKIWDKTGAVALAQTYMFQLFAVPGYDGAGDPVALYDQFSDRYYITEFGFSGGVTTFVNTLIIGVSLTNDPTGAWSIYKFVDNSFFVDYPHWGVWPNAIYATSNDFNTAGNAYLGSSVYAFDKNAMLAGAATATMLRQRFNNADQVYGSIAPVSISGSTPPASGSPGLFMYYSDDNWTAAPGDVDFLQLLTFQPNFVTPASTVITLGQIINTAPFKSGMCNFARSCIPSAGGNYDAISDRIMNRIYYRNFGTHEALVLNYTVDASFPATPQKAGLRWYELRKTGGPWSIFQQSTYAPDADHRWMGTIGINSLGQIALGYNHSGAGKFASIYFTGRNAGDPLNTLTTGEKLVIQGTAYGTFSNRWGDYNDMATDKTNDVTFWMTAMYGSLASQWKTRVTSFNIGDPCPVITINPATLPNFTFNQPYGATLTATGSAPPYTFFISAGALPPGLTLNSTTGIISGIATGTNASYTFTVNVSDGGGCFGTKVYTLNNNTSFVTTAFCNPAAITLPGSGVGNPYPSNITVSGVTSPVTKVTVSLNGLTHTWPSDIDVLLVGPGGQRAIILSDVGGGTPISDVNLTLDDGTAASLTAAPITSGIYKPTNIGASDPFPAPAPGTTANSALSVFNGVNPNGQWSLYVVDDASGDVGSFSGGWCVNIVTAPLPGGIWTGATSTDWNTASNWSNNAVPTATDNAVIPVVPNKPVLPADVAINNLDIAAGMFVDLNGKQLTINGAVAGAGTLKGSAASALAFAGNLAGTAGTVQFDNTANSLQRLLVNRTGAGAAVTIGNLVNIVDVLDVQNGALNAAGNIVLKSTATNTARVAPVTGSISGDVTVERFIPARRAWRLLAAPVAGTQSINAAWQEGVTSASPNPNPNPGFGTHITQGSSAAGLDFNTAAGATGSLKQYNNVTNTWDIVNNTAIPAVNSNAWFIFVRGDRSISLSFSSVPPNNTTLRSRGNLKTGNQLYNVFPTNLTPVANPYAAPINFATITKTNVANSFFLVDPKMGASGAFVNVIFNTATGVYDVTPSTFVSPNSQYIQSGQGFLVSSIGGGAASIIIKESDKSATPAASVFRPNAPDKSLRINLQQVATDNTSTLIDGVLCSYATQFSNKVDEQDVVKPENPFENLGMVREGKTIMVERRNGISAGDQIQLKLWNTNPGNYSFEFDPLNLSLEQQPVFLEDRYLHTFTPISLEISSSISFKITADAGSSNPNRFTVVFGNRKSINEELVSANNGVKVFPNPVTGHSFYLQLLDKAAGTYLISVVDMTGKVVFTTSLIHHGGTFTKLLKLKSALSKGMYQVKVNAGGKLSTIPIILN
ncbi:MAG: type sorting protein [Flavisolibacter sp.]|nr:type sorting protein [Flavisolibacter sp.]